MRKIIVQCLVAGLSIVLFSSCKKEYTCSCKLSTKRSLKAVMEEYKNYEGQDVFTGSGTEAYEKTSKKVAKAACGRKEFTESHDYYDEMDADGDGRTNEIAYTIFLEEVDDCALD